MDKIMPEMLVFPYLAFVIKLDDDAESNTEHTVRFENIVT